MASAMPAGDGGLSGLPSPPPAIRPPEAAPAAPAPAPAQAEPALPAMAPAAPVESAAPAIDYFAADATAIEEPAPVENLPAEAPAAPAQPAPAPVVELQTIPLMAPAEPEPAAEAEPQTAAEPAPAEPVVELPEMAPRSEPVTAEVEPLVAPAPVELAPEPVDVVLPVAEPLAAAESAGVAELEELFAPKRSTDFRVIVRLKDCDGVEVSSFRDFGTAMEAAQEVVEQFSTATEGKWPFYAGRFIRPDLIVSVDVVEGGDEL
jgi:hypothetical protein